jgi:hypothetical protein
MIRAIPRHSQHHHPDRRRAGSDQPSRQGNPTMTTGKSPKVALITGQNGAYLADVTNSRQIP